MFQYFNDAKPVLRYDSNETLLLRALPMTPTTDNAQNDKMMLRLLCGSADLHFNFNCGRAIFYYHTVRVVQ